MRSRTTTVALAVGLLLLAGCEQRQDRPTDTQSPTELVEPADGPADDQPMDGYGCQ